MTTIRNTKVIATQDIDENIPSTQLQSNFLTLLPSIDDYITIIQNPRLGGDRIVNRGNQNKLKPILKFPPPDRLSPLHSHLAGGDADPAPPVPPDWNRRFEKRAAPLCDLTALLCEAFSRPAVTADFELLPFSSRTTETTCGLEARASTGPPSLFDGCFCW